MNLLHALVIFTVIGFGGSAGLHWYVNSHVRERDFLQRLHC